MRFILKCAVLLLGITSLSLCTFAQRRPYCGLGIPQHARVAAAKVGTTLSPADTSAAPVMIDVMFLYTPQALTGAGTLDRLQQRVREAIDEANFLYTNSQVNIALNPVYIGAINYSESGDIQADLNAIGYGDGAFVGVSSLRNDYKADIVCLITETENAGIGGLAWDIPDVRGNARTAFLAVRRLALGRDLTLAHEIGHLCGCAHDREHAGDPQSPFYLSLRPYIFGYRLQIEDVTYIDVMAYPPGVALPNFANPRMQIDGVPLGIPEGGDLPSDTARTINETAPYVAAYRQALSRISFESAQQQALQADGAITLAIIRTGDLSGATQARVSVAPDSTAQAGVDYLLPSSSIVSFAAGVSNASLVFPLLQPQTSGTKTIHATLNTPAGFHGIGAQGDTTVFIREHLPVVQAKSALVRESAGGIDLTPTFSGPALAELPKIFWHLASDTAIAGTDFVDANGQLQIKLIDGAYQTAPIHISIINDSVPEPDKTFKVIFDGTTQAGTVYASATNQIRLIDDDRPGALIDVPGAQLAADGSLSAAVRDDHKLLVWGTFSKLAGVSRTAIALLNADGTVDPAFQPPELIDGHRKLPHLPNSYISSVQILPDGKLLVAGEFQRADGQPRSTLARLNADGSLDKTFGVDLKFDGEVDALVVQPDGRILVGGAFENINGERHAFIARLNADGTIDNSFAPKGGPASSWTVFVLSLALQPDGKILMGGLFETVDGVDSPNLARLNPDGTLDPTFQILSVSGPVIEVKRQTDGRVVLAGLFDTVAGQPSRKLARLNADGSIDPTFNPPMPNAEVRDVITLPDGRLLVSGAFTQLASSDRRFISMLNPDGTLDSSFDLGTGPDDRVGVLTMHADGSLYIPGRQQTLDGLAAANIARVKFGPTPSAIIASDLTPHGESLLRMQVFPGGSYKVEQSEDLVHWTDAATFNATGFSLEANLSLPAAGAREFYRLINSLR